MASALSGRAAYYDKRVRAAAQQIDEHPVLQFADSDAQRFIFVVVCQAIQRPAIEADFATFRSRVLHAYRHSGLPQRFPSRQSQLQRSRDRRDRPAKTPREAGGRARSAPAAVPREQMYVHLLGVRGRGSGFLSSNDDDI